MRVIRPLAFIPIPFTFSKTDDEFGAESSAKGGSEQLTKGKNRVEKAELSRRARKLVIKMFARQMRFCRHFLHNLNILMFA